MGLKADGEQAAISTSTLPLIFFPSLVLFRPVLTFPSLFLFLQKTQNNKPARGRHAERRTLRLAPRVPRFLAGARARPRGPSPRHPPSRRDLVPAAPRLRRRPPRDALAGRSSLRPHRGGGGRPPRPHRHLLPRRRLRHEGPGDGPRGPRERAPDAQVRGGHRGALYRHPRERAAGGGLLLLRVRVPGVLGEFCFVFVVFGCFFCLLKKKKRKRREKRAHKRNERERKREKKKNGRRKNPEKNSLSFSFNLLSPPTLKKQSLRASPASRSRTSSTRSSPIASTSPSRPRTGRSTSSPTSTPPPRGPRSPTTRSRSR